eukprot:916250-Pleurochrysis_carterae.AAC.1
MNYHLAKALASLRPAPDMLPQPTQARPPTNAVPIPVAVAQPIGDTYAAPQPTQSAPANNEHELAGAASSTQNNAEPAERAPFQRGLGSYPLRSSALLVTRRHLPHNAASLGVKGHGCALAASAVSTDPRT